MSRRTVAFGGPRRKLAICGDTRGPLSRWGSPGEVTRQLDKELSSTLASDAGTALAPLDDGAESHALRMRPLAHSASASTARRVATTGSRPVLTADVAVTVLAATPVAAVKEFAS